MRYLFIFSVLICSFTNNENHGGINCIVSDIELSHVLSKLQKDIKLGDFFLLTGIYKITPFSWTYNKNDYFFFGSSQGIAYFPKALRLKKDLRIGFLLLEHRTYTIIPNLIANITYRLMMDHEKLVFLKILYTLFGITLFPLSLSLLCLEYKCVRFSFISICDLIRLGCVLTLKNTNDMKNEDQVWHIDGYRFIFVAYIFLGFLPNEVVKFNLSKGPMFSNYTKCLWLLYTLIPRISIDLVWWLNKKKKK